MLLVLPSMSVHNHKRRGWGVGIDKKDSEGFKLQEDGFP